MIFQTNRFFNPTLFLAIFFVSLVTVSQAGTLTGIFTPIVTGSNVDLTATGKLDWVHWGLYTADSLNRKASVTPQISNFTVIGNAGDYTLTAYQYTDNSNSYSWFDGTPVMTVTNTTSGVWAYGYPILLGSGFQITAPADTTQRTLLVYVGTFAGRGKLTAALSDGSASIYTNTDLYNSANGPGGVYALTYTADSSGQNLIVQWTLDSVAPGPNSTSANVTLQAAALTATNADNT